MVMDYKEPHELTEAQRIAAGGTAQAIHKIVTIIIHDHNSLVEMGAAVKFLGAMMEIRGGLKDTPFKDIAWLTTKEIKECNENIRRIARGHGIRPPRERSGNQESQEHSGDIARTATVTPMNAQLHRNKKWGS